jgi:hypothetical protein
MKVFWVLAWETYYPKGGLGNVLSMHETLEEANEAAEKIRIEDQWPPYDFVAVEDVSEMLGIKEKNT